MGKIKNVSGEDLVVPWLGGRLVVAGQAVEVPDDEVYAYTQQTSTWAPGDEAAEKAHDDAHAEYLAQLSPVEQVTAEPPAGNASREAWAEFALAAGKTEHELDGLSRDQIRDMFTDGSN